MECIEGLGDKPKFLLCNFAQGREYWESKFPGYSDEIKVDMPDNINPSFVLAFPDDFVDQCKEADIIYLHGGDDHLIQYWLKKFNLEDIFKDKVVATNSAASDVLVASYWTCDWRLCREGLGILPIKFIPHFKSKFGTDDPRGPIDWEQAYKELEEFGDKSLPIHALEEGQFIVIEQ